MEDIDERYKHLLKLERAIQKVQDKKGVFSETNVLSFLLCALFLFFGIDIFNSGVENKSEKNYFIKNKMRFEKVLDPFKAQAESSFYLTRFSPFFFRNRFLLTFF